MNTQEAAALLSIAAAFDNRKPDPDAATAWAAALGDLRFVDCREAIVAHYRACDDWLMPSKVIGEVKRIRAKRIAEHPPVIPPADCTDDRAWLAEINRRIGDGEVFNPDQFRGELKARDMKALTGADPSEAVNLLRSQLRDRHDRKTAAPSKPTDPDHARRKAAAMAELDAIRTKDTNPTPAEQGAGEQQEAS